MTSRSSNARATKLPLVAPSLASLGVLGVLGVLGAAAMAVACSSSNSHPKGAAECTRGVDCVGVGSPGGPVLGGDATTDGDAADGSDAEVASDAGADGAEAPETGEAGATITVTSGTVNIASSPTIDPGSDPLDGTDSNLSIQGSTGGAVHTSPVSGGHFSFSAADVDGSGFALLQLKALTSSSVDLRTLYELFSAGSPTITTPVAVPIFDKGASAKWASDLGLTIPTAGKATAIYQLVDATGAGVSGVTVTLIGGPSAACTAGTASGPCGPYYDSGDVLAAGATTGPRGIAVFLGLDGGGASLLPIDVTLGGTASGTIKQMSTGNDAITFVRYPVK